MAVFHRAQVGDATAGAAFGFDKPAQTPSKTVVVSHFGSRIFERCSHDRDPQGLAVGGPGDGLRDVQIG